MLCLQYVQTSNAVKERPRLSSEQLQYPTYTQKHGGSRIGRFISDTDAAMWSPSDSLLHLKSRTHKKLPWHANPWECEHTDAARSLTDIGNLSASCSGRFTPIGKVPGGHLTSWWYSEATCTRWRKEKYFRSCRDLTLGRPHIRLPQTQFAAIGLTLRGQAHVKM
jgi:hypothetical protein